MGSKKKILIADDSELNRSLLSDMLADTFDIVEVENGMEAMAVLHEQELEICLLLLDIVMPVMDGFEVLAAMNKSGLIKSIPVIMISAETNFSYVDRSYALGASEYISRPFDERTVRHRVISTIMLSSKQKELSQMLAIQMYEKEKDNRLMIEILSNLMEFRNGESGLHVLHIHTITKLLLETLINKTDRYHISQNDINLITNASALHDIGKIAIPTEILNKPGKLTDEEFAIMKTHSAEGARILSDIPLRENEPLIKVGYQICRWHHERYDGRGYPDGLKGEEIPIGAQVVALADVYDALTSKRVYKDAFSHEKAVNMIVNGECGIFNPLLLECLEEIAETLKHELHVASIDSSSEKEILSAVETMMKDGEMGTSKRTIQLIEREKMKYNFFARLSKEILFDYTVIPEMIILSEWGAEYLGMQEKILTPKESDFGAKIFSPQDFNDLLEKMKNTTPEDSVTETKYLLDINGQKKWNKIIAKSVWSDDDVPEYMGAFGKIVDIDDEKKKMQHLESLATRDQLTGLLNHKAFKSEVSRIINSGDGRKYILVFFDMDNFKMANDEYGHMFGDEVLKHAAERIKHSIRNADIASRMGGDEFLIFMEYKDDPEPQVKRIFNQISGEYKDFNIRLSMGISFAKDAEGEYDKLFNMADMAAYSVKQTGKNSYRFYDETVSEILNESSFEERKL
ncbi:MAG: diguanylate cyclase [Firmicutes bacterium]|nr:diguanylate cyclase [Bacillota bacterium]